MQNALSTSVASMGYEYDTNEQTGRFYLNYSYLGWYPVIDLTAYTSLRRYHGLDQNQQDFSFPWRENSFYVSMSVPLTFRHRQYFYGIIPRVRTGILQALVVDDSPDFLEDNNVLNMQYRMLFYRQRFSVARDIRPRWGQILDVNFRHTPFGGADMGYVVSARAIGFFPGILRHHSLQLGAAWQQQQAGERLPNRIRYTFPNLINYPRGISGQFHQEVYSFSADYALPLFYPDLSLPPVIFLQRVSMNLFTDYALARTGAPDDDTRTEDVFNTIGVDLLADMHLLRFVSRLSAGGRFTYEPSTGNITYQALIGIRF
jgi:hypothetical protein